MDTKKKAKWCKKMYVSEAKTNKTVLLVILAVYHTITSSQLFFILKNSRLFLLLLGCFLWIQHLWSQAEMKMEFMVHRTDIQFVSINIHRVREKALCWVARFEQKYQYIQSTETWFATFSFAKWKWILL
jgi:hypothetical protein